MADVGSIAVNLTARTARFERKMRAAIGLISRVGFVATSVAGGGLGYLTSQSFRLVDAQTKAAEKLGTTQAKMAGFTHAAGLAGIQSTKLETAFQRMVRRVSEAGQGTGEARGAIRELGLDAKALGNQLPAQQFETIIGALSRVERQSDRVRLAFKLFDTEGVDLVRLISQDLNAAADEAEKFGLTVNRIDAAKIEAANDATFRLRQFMRGIANTIAIQVAPFVAFASNKFVEMGTAGEGASSKIVSAMERIEVVVARAIDLVDFLKATFLSVKGVLANVAANTPLVRLFDLISGKDIAGALKASAVEDIGEAASIFERIGTGANTERVRGFFNSVRDEAQKAAESVAARSEQLFGGLGAAGSSLKVADFREIDRSRFAVGGIGSAGGEQRVKDPQLEQTNRLLQSIENRLAGGVPAVAV